MHTLPVRSLGAAANMAADQLLLEAWPEPDAPRFRHYRWNEPAFTFGRSQRWQDAAACLPVHASWREAHEHFAGRFQLVRRSSGGGVVDHRDDWTYALVIPASNALARARAGQAYREVHDILAWALRAQQVKATLAPCPCDRTVSTQPAQACFQRAEPGDVMSDAGEKLAGAAQRRTRDGLLLQGSVTHGPLRALDWDRFESDFGGALAEWLGGTPSARDFPKWPQTRLTALIRHYASPGWNHRR